MTNLNDFSTAPNYTGENEFTDTYIYLCGTKKHN